MDKPTRQELAAAYELYFHEFKEIADAVFIKHQWEKSAHTQGLYVQRVRVVTNALKNCVKICGECKEFKLCAADTHICAVEDDVACSRFMPAGV